MLLGDLGEGFVRRLPVEPHGGGAFLQLACQEQRREGSRDVVEDALAPLLLALDTVPLAAHLAGRLRHRVAEDVRVAADQLVLDLARHRAHVAGIALLEKLREEVDLHEQVAELAVLLAEVVLGDGVGELVHLLDGVRDDVARRLHAIPGALLTQDGDDAPQRDERLPGEGIGEGSRSGASL